MGKGKGWDEAWIVMGGEIEIEEAGKVEGGKCNDDSECVALDRVDRAIIRQWRGWERAGTALWLYGVGRCGWLFGAADNMIGEGQIRSASLVTGMLHW